MKISQTHHKTKSGIIKRNPTGNYYMVIKDIGKKQGMFYMFPRGTHTTYGALKDGGKVLYEGTNSSQAMNVYRNNNNGYGKFDDKHQTYIYKTINGKPPMGPNMGMVIHRV